MNPSSSFLFFFFIIFQSAYSQQNSTQIVYDYVQSQANLTYKPPSGDLKYPYLVPSGPYDELWDWDSVFMGNALLSFGSAEYLAGSMMNFFDHTNVTTGEVRGCITPDGDTATIYQAKPILVQGAWLVAKYQKNYTQFLPFQSQMEAFLMYSEKQRRQNDTGLYVWYDQLESGADNLVLSQCPSAYSTDCWVNGSGMSLGSADMMTLLYREKLSYYNFLTVWGADAQARSNISLDQLKQEMQSIQTTIDTYLWNKEKGFYAAWNVTTKTSIMNRTYVMGFPLFGGLSSSDQVSQTLSNLKQSDMNTKYGIRSTSSSDPRYNNDNIIVPYSNWRGPIWINANAIIAYGLNDYGYQQDALNIANAIVDVLANDILNTNTWHESYSSETGAGLAADGFLSWNTLGATIQANIMNKINPFKL